MRRLVRSNEYPVPSGWCFAVRNDLIGSWGRNHDFVLLRLVIGVFAIAKTALVVHCKLKIVDYLCSSISFAWPFRSCS